MKIDDMKAGCHYWVSHNDGSDRALVYCYVNPDAGDGLGIGFNLADGAGWVPLWDIPSDTIVEELYTAKNARIAELEAAIRGLVDGKDNIFVVSVETIKEQNLAEHRARLEKARCLWVDARAALERGER